MQRRMLNRVARGSAPRPSGSAAAALPPPPAATAGMPVVAPVTATPSAAGDQLVNIPAYLKGGAALNGVLPSLLEGSIPDVVEKLFKFWGFEPQLMELRGKLIKISLLYKDGEGKMYSKAGKGVADWIDGVREAAYEMNDIIDDMNAEVLRLQVEFQWNKFFEYEIELKLGHVMQKLDVLDTKARRDHELKPASDDDGWVSDYRKSHKTTPSVDASAVYGRKEDLDRLVKSLLEPFVSDKRCNYSVVGIIGSGGIGKTTLAKLVLEDKRVVEEFSLRSWACVSDGAFNAERVLKDLYTYGRGEGNNGDFALLQKKVGELVMGKKFLFVLDDVWTDRDKDWEDFRIPFHSCGVGSIFVVTTRNGGVLDMMHSRVAHTLGPLADAHMWKLFSEKVFIERNSNEDLIKIGHDIVNKCKGVPLSAKVLGRILRSQVDKRKWENVLESSYWDLPEEGDEDLPALRISHYHLPFHLKLCFEYLSLFPSDHIFNKRYLVQLWIGEGFVRPERGRYLEDIGSEYYEELQERSLIEEDDKMHDLAHSLACKLSKKFNSRVVNEAEIDKRIVIRARHVLFDGRPALPLASEELHTCVYLPKYMYFRCWNLPPLKYLHVLDLNHISIQNMSDNFFSDFRHLRYLRLTSVLIIKLPLSIHRLQSLQTLILQDCGILEDIRAEVVNLVSLIHLDLSNTEVSTLPMWLCNLPCLQTLNLKRCIKHREIPTEIEKLQTLRELDLLGTNILFLPDSLCKIANLEALNSEILPKFIGRLTQLKVMPVYKVGIEEGRGIGELQNLRNLVLLRLCCLENVKSVKEAKMAALANKKSLTFLSFAWNKATSIEEEEDEDHGKSDCEVLEALQPHPTKIKYLHFEGYKGEEFPSWMRGSHFSSLKRLCMIGMERLTRVAHATFNSLSELYIRNCPSMEAVLIAAPMLEDLTVESCSNLRCLSLNFCDGALIESSKGLDVNNCANLRWLRVTGCHQLESLGNKGLPQSLETINLTSEKSEILPKFIRRLTQFKVMPVYKVGIEEGRGIEELQNLRNLVSLSLSCLENIKSVKEAKMAALENKKSLTFLSFAWNKATSIEEEEDEDQGKSDCEVLEALQPHPAKIESLIFDGYEGEEFPSWMRGSHFSSLKRLCMIGMERLTRVAHATFNSLSELYIRNCSSMEAVLIAAPMLEDLTVESCSNLRCLSLNFCDGALIESPKGLDVNNCANLRWLRVTGCHQLESLGNKGLPQSLMEISLSDCENLTSLLRSMHNHALLKLEIKKCPRLESFGEQGLPHSLQTFFLEDCESLKSLPRSVPSLDSLQEVRIINCRQICLAEDWLPRSLRLDSVRVINCPGLKSFPTYMDQLNSLQILAIEGCPQLESFPDPGLPHSIQSLTIRNCQNLRSLPSGLPNFMDMTIEGCPKLQTKP